MGQHFLGSFQNGMQFLMFHGLAVLMLPAPKQRLLEFKEEFKVVVYFGCRILLK